MWFRVLVFLLNQISKDHCKQKGETRPDAALASDLGLRCLPMSHKKDTSGLYGLSWHSKINLKPKVPLQS